MGDKFLESLQTSFCTHVLGFCSLRCILGNLPAYACVLEDDLDVFMTLFISCLFSSVNYQLPEQGPVTDPTGLMGGTGTDRLGWDVGIHK